VLAHWHVCSGSCWTLCGPCWGGGNLLYVVCSVFPEEGRSRSNTLWRGSRGGCDALPGGSPTVCLLPVAPGSVAWEAGRPWPTLHDGFSTHCSKVPMNLVTALRGSGHRAAMLAGAAPGGMPTSGIGVIAAELEPAPAGWAAAVLKCHLRVEMPRPSDEAVQKGIAILPSTSNSELYRKRWVLLDPQGKREHVDVRLPPVAHAPVPARPAGAVATLRFAGGSAGAAEERAPMEGIEKGVLSPGDSYDRQVRLPARRHQLPNRSRSTPLQPRVEPGPPIARLGGAPELAR